MSNLTKNIMFAGSSRFGQWFNKQILSQSGNYYFEDESGHNRHVQIKNTQVAKFNGTSHGVISTNGKYINGGTSIDLTIEFKGLNITTAQYLFSCGGLVAGQKGVVIGFASSKITIYSNEGVARVVWQSPVVTATMLGGVNTLQFVWDGTTTNGGATAILNGTSYSINIIKPWSGAATYPNLIGYFYTGGYVNCEIHRVKLINTLGAFEYEFNESEGTNIADISGNSNYGTVVGADLATFWGTISDTKEPTLISRGYTLFQNISTNAYNRQINKLDGNPATLKLTGYNKISEIPSFASGTTRNRFNIVCYGNSLTVGVACSVSSSYPTLLQGMFDASNFTATVLNRGISGYSGTQMVDNFIANIHPYYDAKKINIMILFEFVNDIVGSSKTATQAYNNIISVIALAKEIGFIVIVSTAPPSTGDPTSKIQDANNMLRANKGNADYLMDIWNYPQMTNASDTNYFCDGTHVTTYEYFKLGFWGILQPILQSLIDLNVEKFGFSNSGNKIYFPVDAELTSFYVAQGIDLTSDQTYLNIKALIESSKLKITKGNNNISALKFVK